MLFFDIVLNDGERNMLIKNIYDDSTLDTLRALDQNLRALMGHNPDYKGIEVTQYERVPATAANPKSQIRVDVLYKDTKGHFFISEEFVTKLEESNEIRKELSTMLKQIKMALKQ